MEDTFVALDIETTGTDPQRDAVIEIGAVRFSLRRVESDWSTLINPGRNIPESITQLTGITNEMVRAAPRLEQVLQELAEFVGDAVIVGHNIRFDLSFFERYRLSLIARWWILTNWRRSSFLLPVATVWGRSVRCWGFHSRRARNIIAP
jgi:DNA polymerase-3 subunit epsilon/ATP-dependent DNA helicase DinG